MTQRIVLSMIVKNEEAVIDRCLDSVLPHVNHAVINDNGSTDRTLEILTARGVEIFATQWWDFATNRNVALQEAEVCGEYVLCGLDADEELVVPDGWVWPELAADVYTITCHYGPLRYQRRAVVRSGAHFHWRGVIHEALVCDEAHTEARLPDVYIQVHSDGARARDPATSEHDLEVLLKAVRDEPKNSRYRFYLAQTLKDLGRYADARDSYQARVSMTGWPEETAYAEYMCGKMTVLLNDGDPTRMLLNAFSWNPARAEPLVELARYYRITGQFALAAAFANLAVQLPMPESGLFVEHDAYEWRALDELLISAYYVPALKFWGEQAAREIVTRDIPPDHIERIRASTLFYTRM